MAGIARVQFVPSINAVSRYYPLFEVIFKKLTAYAKASSLGFIVRFAQKDAKYFLFEQISTVL